MLGRGRGWGGALVSSWGMTCTSPTAPSSTEHWFLQWWGFENAPFLSLFNFCTPLRTFPGISSHMNSYSNPHLWAMPPLISWSLLHQGASPSLEHGLRLWPQRRTPHRTEYHAVYQPTPAHMLRVNVGIAGHHSCPSRWKPGPSWSKSGCVGRLLRLFWSEPCLPLQHFYVPRVHHSEWHWLWSSHFPHRTVCFQRRSQCPSSHVLLGSVTLPLSHQVARTCFSSPECGQMEQPKPRSGPTACGQRDVVTSEAGSSRSPAGTFAFGLILFRAQLPWCRVREGKLRLLANSLS